MSDNARFWETVPLGAMSRDQWEQLCDRCGRCCLHKLRDDDDAIHFTNVACRLLDPDTGCCGDYARRARRVPDCVRLAAAELRLPAAGGRRTAAVVAPAGERRS